MKRAPRWKEIVIDYLLRRDNDACQLCGRPFFKDDVIEIDHIVEEQDGGNAELENLRVLHLSCHRLRHQPGRKKTMDFYFDKRKQEPPPKVEPIKLVVHLQKAKDDVVMATIRDSLLRHNLNTTRAAKELGISRPTLYDFMARNGLKKEDAESWQV